MGRRDEETKREIKEDILMNLNSLKLEPTMKLESMKSETEMEFEKQEKRITEV